jgi:5'-nucleotidase (lipoprotein e(P4) family)
MTLAVLYQQKSGEWRALSYQAFTLARLVLEKDLADKNINQHRCVVVDIDETVLDNSPYQAECILTQTAYNTQTWNDWCNRRKALPLPGAAEFFHYVKANGVDVYYVTNRKEEVREATLDNLKKAEFPFADDAHLLMPSGESSKEARRLQIMQRNHISLLMGDNLNDFAQVFENKTPAERMQLVDKMYKEFGRKFIVLPNAMYGDWEGAIYNYDWSSNDTVKATQRMQALEGINKIKE